MLGRRWVSWKFRLRTRSNGLASPEKEEPNRQNDQYHGDDHVPVTHHATSSRGTRVPGQDSFDALQWIEKPLISGWPPMEAHLQSLREWWHKRQ